MSALKFTSGAQSKAARHRIALHELRPWTRPLQEQFPALTMEGTAEERFADYQNDLLLRSTEIRFPLEPAVTIWRTFPVPHTAPKGTVPSGPAWPYSHTLDVLSDDVYAETGKGVCRIDLITINGYLQWQRIGDKSHYYVIDQIWRPLQLKFAGHNPGEFPIPDEITLVGTTGKIPGRRVGLIRPAALKSIISPVVPADGRTCPAEPAGHRTNRVPGYQ